MIEYTESYQSIIDGLEEEIEAMKCDLETQLIAIAEYEKENQKLREALEAILRVEVKGSAIVTLSFVQGIARAALGGGND